MVDEFTAGFLWWSRLAWRQYHEAMADKIAMVWLKHRSPLAFNARHPGQWVIFVFDNASYRHGFNPEVKVPENNTKKDNIELLRKCRARSITVKRGI